MAESIYFLRLFGGRGVGIIRFYPVRDENSAFLTVTMLKSGRKKRGTSVKCPVYKTILRIT